MPAKGTRHDTKALGPGGSIARGSRYGKAKRKLLETRVLQLEAALYATTPRDLQLLRESGALTEGTRRYADVAAATLLRLRRAAEGIEGETTYRPLPEQRVALLEVAERILLLALCESARALTAGDGEAAARAGTLYSKFAQLVEKAIGLNAMEAEVPSLSDYMRDKSSQTPASATNGDASDAVIVEPESASDSPNSSADSHVVAPTARDNGGGSVEGLRDSARSRAVANESTSAEPSSSGAEETRDESNTPV